eukprot:CAMPEP_0168712458 /NCGR_PEP_ID=MMETSP0503-20121227/43668_1 /TAXON_ID=89963 /ORGANISM="Heterocapsa rotundata, Strain SCCAP K-0483" /LENGTH=59 /DNA_ID=CAMNT_0008758831 /DNA_START=55 /DNA_END=231 /DNA_ORIENTATION=-
MGLIAPRRISSPCLTSERFTSRLKCSAERLARPMASSNGSAFSFASTSALFISRPPRAA